MKWLDNQELQELFDANPQLNFVKKVRQQELCPASELLLVKFCYYLIFICTRKGGAQNAVDKMENTMQNIFLQEMGNLDGIMIATTNLTENLDPAFERRFLYKILFEKPDAAVCQKIWQQMIPELRTDDAAVLAGSFDFSGGQIENIARKHSINSILYGEGTEVLPVLENYCRSEQLSNTVTRKRIGF